MTTHVYTPTRARARTRPRAHFPSCLLPPPSPRQVLSLWPFHPSRSSPFRSFSLVLARSRSFSLTLARSLVLAACTRRRRTSDVGEERHSRGENENAGAPREQEGLRERGWMVARRTGRVGRVNTERGVTQGRQQNAGIGEAVTMTTVTGEVLVRIRDHAYVTTP